MDGHGFSDLRAGPKEAVRAFWRSCKKSLGVSHLYLIFLQYPWKNNLSNCSVPLRSNITTSLEFFPQIYPSLLQFLEKSSKGYGRELRKFILVMQKATERAVRIASQIVELCEQNADVVAKSKSLFRMKSLES